MMLHAADSNYKWKPFSIEDLPLILHHQKELYSLNFVDMKFDSVFFANIRQWYSEGIRRYQCYSNLLLDEQDELIGFYLYQWNEGSVYLMQMFVEGSSRSQGYGSLLLKHYEQCGKNQEATSSFLHASSINTKAVAFYERNGYSILAEELDEEGCIRYFMYKYLA